MGELRPGRTKSLIPRGVYPNPSAAKEKNEREGENIRKCQGNKCKKQKQSEK
jgi:hypothetical protein